MSAVIFISAPRLPPTYMTTISLVHSIQCISIYTYVSIVLYHKEERLGWVQIAMDGNPMGTIPIKENWSMSLK